MESLRLRISKDTDAVLRVTEQRRLKISKIQNSKFQRRSQYHAQNRDIGDRQRRSSKSVRDTSQPHDEQSRDRQPDQNNNPASVPKKLFSNGCPRENQKIRHSTGETVVDRETPQQAVKDASTGNQPEKRRLRRIETRRSATHETLLGNLRENGIGQFHASRKRQHDNCGAVQHMEETIEKGYTVVIKEDLGQTVRTVWLVHEPTEREEDACRTKGEAADVVVKQLQEEAACT